LASQAGTDPNHDRQCVFPLARGKTQCCRGRAESWAGRGTRPRLLYRSPEGELKLLEFLAGREAGSLDPTPCPGALTGSPSAEPSATPDLTWTKRPGHFSRAAPDPPRAVENRSTASGSSSTQGRIGLELPGSHSYIPGFRLPSPCEEPTHKAQPGGTRRMACVV